MIRNIYANKRSKKAVKQLRVYLSEIDSIATTPVGNIWKDKVLTSFAIYFGQDADLYKRLSKTFFTENQPKVVSGIIGIFDNHVFSPEKKERFKTILNSAIQIVENNGIKQDYSSSNFLGKFSDEFVWGVLIAIAGATFTITTLLLDKEDKTSELEVKRLKTLVNQKSDSLKSEIKTTEKLSKIITKDSIQNIGSKLTKTTP